MRKGPRLPQQALQPFTIEVPFLGPGSETAGSTPPTEVLNWQVVFGNDRPVEIEVGSGKGLFLVTAGQANPGTNYVGIEIVRKYQLYTATRLAKRNLTNVRAVCADARVFLRDRVASESVQTVHVYFPDPWWKTRHHKRRVFTGEFAAQRARAQTRGSLLVVTDVEDYAAMVREAVSGHTPLVESSAPPEHEPAHEMDYLTNFERKFRQEGRAIYRLGFEKP